VSLHKPIIEEFIQDTTPILSKSLKRKRLEVRLNWNLSSNVSWSLIGMFKRLKVMGFDGALVLEVFFACNKNEELAANYLLDHMHNSED
jgi:hypothetical protein